MDISASNVVAIPLDELRVSSLNARTIDTKSLDEMAASIVAEGLLQNLTVTEAADGLYEVVAGKRRLGALMRLREQGLLPADLQSPPCRIVDGERALSASLAENVVREAMHPADEFVAFRNLADNGRSIEDIAAEFGVVPLVVERRLRLARIAPSLFELFRNGEMQLDQAMALTLSQDHKAQEAAWNVKNQWERQAHSLRERLTKAEINVARDPAARYVGVTALAEAGVIIRKDLFSERGDGYTDDRLLIDQLALAKLERDADAVREEGWSWVEARIDFPYDEQAKFERVRADTTKTELTAAEQRKLKELRVQLESVDPDEDEGQDGAYEEIEAEIAALEDRSLVWTPKQLAACGAVVAIGHDGRIEVERGLAKVSGGRTSKADTRGKPASKGTEKKPDLSESVIRRLTAHRTAILQGVVLNNQSLALTLIAYSLMTTMLYADRHQPRASKIIFSSAGPLEQLADELPMMRHTAVAQERIAALAATVPPATKLFAWLLAQKPASLIDLITWCVALSIDTVERSGADKSMQGLAAEIVAAADVDLADYWEPTRESFLAHVPRSVIEQAVFEARGESDVAKLATMKKDQLVDAAEQLLAGKRWLPKPLRCAAAKATTSSDVKSDAPAKKAAAKRPAKAAKKPVKKTATKKSAAKKR